MISDQCLCLQANMNIIRTPRHPTAVYTDESNLRAQMRSLPLSHVLSNDNITVGYNGDDLKLLWIVAKSYITLDSLDESP